MEGQGVASSSQTEKVACTGRCCNSSNKQRETVRMFEESIGEANTTTGLLHHGNTMEKWSGAL